MGSCFNIFSRYSVCINKLQYCTRNFFLKILRFRSIFTILCIHFFKTILRVILFYNFSCKQCAHKKHHNTALPKFFHNTVHANFVNNTARVKFSTIQRTIFYLPGLNFTRQPKAKFYLSQATE